MFIVKNRIYIQKALISFIYNNIIFSKYIYYSIFYLKTDFFNFLLITFAFTKHQLTQSVKP